MTASLFLQLFALVSPLFFQVVIDKVLVHRSLSTLDVLIFGLVAIGLFEAMLGALRTYLFAHTTNRIDVELGARLFRHLISLPIAYFQSRRVGDSVARVRELENIRQFITSSALTLVIDLLFTFVFLAVMAYYSPTLTLVAVGGIPVLHRHLGRTDAAVPASSRREVPARRGEPVVPGRERHRDRNAEGDGGRAADAAALGGAARRLRRLELPRHQPQQRRERVRAAHQQAGHGRDALLRRQARDRRLVERRRTRGLQHAVGPRQRAGAAARLRSGRTSTRPAFRWIGSATSSTPCRSRP